MLLTVAAVAALTSALEAMPPAYAAAFYPASQPAAWRDPGFVTGDGPAAGHQAVFSFDPETRPAYWGTWSPPADAAGEGRAQLRSAVFTTEVRQLVVPVMGKLDDGAIILEREDGLRLHAAEVWRVGRASEMPRFLRFELEPGARWRVVATDDDPGRDQWLGFAPPIPCADRAAAQAVVHRWRDVYRNDYTYFVRALGVTFALIGLPLLAFAWAGPRAAWRGWTTLAAVIGAWALAGGLRWGGADATAAHLARGLAWVNWAAALAAPAVGLIRGRGQRALPVAIFATYAASVALAHIQTVPDVPVRGENSEGTPDRGRMVAAPPDSILPFRTAVYFHHHKDGREDRVVYFGVDWSVTSRGPLLPLVITGVFAARGHVPHDPPYPAPRRWPADDDGVYLARAATIALNALVLPAVATLAALLVPRRRATTALAAAALTAITPCFTANLVYVWPKLLAVTGVLLAAALIVAGRPRWWPLVLAGGYFAHPLAALFFPALIVLERWPQRRAPLLGALRAAVIRALTLVAALVPWLAYKAWEGHPDLLTRYPLGDGRGFNQALSVGSWLACRWENAVRTFVPFGAWWDLREYWWYEDLIRGPALWTVYTSRSLFGEVGLPLTIALVLGSRRLWREQRATLAAVALGALTITVYWGFSRIGLGRQCVEPLTAIAVALAASLPAVSGRWRGPILLLAAIEFLFVTYAGIDWEDTEAPAFLLLREWPYAVAVIALAFAPAAIALVFSRWLREADHQTSASASRTA